MGFALVLRELSRRRWLVGVGVLVAAVAAIFSVYRLDGFSLKARSLQHSSASTQVLVDSPSSVLGNASQSVEPLVTRAAVYANFMTNPAVLELIGKQVGLLGAQIDAAGPVTTGVRVEQEPTALKRNIEITGETKPYRLVFESHANLPTITINSQAPTTKQAVALAGAAVVGMQQYVSELETASRIPPKSRVTIRQLGTASGAVVDAGISKQLAAMVFVAVLLLWCVLVLVASRFIEIWRESAVLEAGGDERSTAIYQEDGGLGDSEADVRHPNGRDPDSAVLDTRHDLSTTARQIQEGVMSASARRPAR